MTVVSMRCHECGEVKREEHMQFRSDGNMVCDGCRRTVPKKEGSSDEEVSTSSNSDRDNESKENAGSAEREKVPLQETFNEQDPLDW